MRSKLVRESLDSFMNEGILAMKPKEYYLQQCHKILEELDEPFMYLGPDPNWDGGHEMWELKNGDDAIIFIYPGEEGDEEYFPGWFLENVGSVARYYTEFNDIDGLREILTGYAGRGVPNKYIL